MEKTYIDLIMQAITKCSNATIVETVALSILIIVVGVLQWWRIKPLKDQLKAQQEVLDKVKGFFDLFDLEQLELYVKISKRTVEMEKNEEIKELQLEYEEKIKKRSAAAGLALKELLAMIRGMLYIFYYTPPNVREAVLNDMTDGPVKDILIDASNKLSKREMEHPLGALGGGLLGSLLAPSPKSIKSE